VTFPLELTGSIAAGHHPYPPSPPSFDGIVSSDRFRGRRKKGCFGPPPRLANGGSLQGLLGATHPPRGTIFVVTWALLVVANFLELRQETVRKVLKVPETQALRAPNLSRSARSGPMHGPNTPPERHANPFSDSFNAKFAELPFHALR
jgi:hypothetical protein